MITPRAQKNFDDLKTSVGIKERSNNNNSKISIEDQITPFLRNTLKPTLSN